MAGAGGAEGIRGGSTAVLRSRANRRADAGARRLARAQQGRSGVGPDAGQTRVRKELGGDSLLDQSPSPGTRGSGGGGMDPAVVWRDSAVVARIGGGAADLEQHRRKTDSVFERACEAEQRVKQGRGARCRPHGGHVGNPSSDTILERNLDLFQWVKGQYIIY